MRHCNHSGTQILLKIKQVQEVKLLTRRSLALVPQISFKDLPELANPKLVPYSRYIFLEVCLRSYKIYYLTFPVVT